MDLSIFFNTSPGMYISQSFFHSIIAAIIMSRSFQVWKITNPRIKQRFRFFVIMFPVMSFPLYHVMNAARGSLDFRLASLMNTHGLLNLELVGNVSVGLFFVLILLVTALIFFFQEMIPILRHMLASKKVPVPTKRPDEDSVVMDVLLTLPAERPDILIISDDDHILYSKTGKEPAIYISTGLIESLTTEQVQTSIAHEIAHVERSRRPLLITIYLLRIIMFFNPVVLLQFRKVAQEEELICDDIAVSLTKKPQALAEALKKLYHTSEEDNSHKHITLSRIKDNLEDYGHNVLIENRIRRLEKGEIDHGNGNWFPFALTVVVTIIINYFVV